MFYVGDIVRCSDSRKRATRMHVQGLMYFQRFEVCRTKNWPDGSQSLYVRARPKSQKTNRPPPFSGERGPYCSLRFELEQRTDTPSYQYDPSQQGDTEDDI